MAVGGCCSLEATLQVLLRAADLHRGDSPLTTRWFYETADDTRLVLSRVSLLYISLLPVERFSLPLYARAAAR
jgi:hypothetical protein